MHAFVSVTTSIRIFYRWISALHTVLKLLAYAIVLRQKKTVTTKFSGTTLNYSPLTLTWNVPYFRMREERFC